MWITLMGRPSSKALLASSLSQSNLGLGLTSISSAFIFSWSTNSFNALPMLVDPRKISRFYNFLSCAHSLHGRRTSVIDFFFFSDPLPWGEASCSMTYIGSCQRSYRRLPWRPYELRALLILRSLLAPFERVFSPRGRLCRPFGLLYIILQPSLHVHLGYEVSEVDWGVKRQVIPKFHA